MLTCGISGRVPSNPVVTRSSGVVFEKSLIEAYIDLHHRCPVTGEPLEKDGLLPLYSRSVCGGAHSTTPTTPPSSMITPLSNEVRGGELYGQHYPIPTLVDRLQEEWKSMQIEQFILRQQLAQTKQELAHALLRNEAACRVVARLHQTCEILRSQGEDGEQGANKSPSGLLLGQAARGAGEIEGVVVLPPAVVKILDAQAEHCREMRKKPVGALQGLPPLPPIERFEFLSVQGVVVRAGAGGGGISGLRESPSSSSSLLCGGSSGYTCGGILHGQQHHPSGVEASPQWVGLGTAVGHIDLLQCETGMVFPFAGVGHTDLVHSLTTVPLPWSNGDGEGNGKRGGNANHKEGKGHANEAHAKPSAAEEGTQGNATTAADGAVEKGRGIPPSCLLISASLDKTVKVWKVVTEGVDAAPSNEELEETLQEEEREEEHAKKRSKLEPADSISKKRETEERGSKPARTEEGGNRAKRPHLHCMDTLHYAHGVSAVAPTLAAGRFLLVAGESRHGMGPYLYFSDLFPQEGNGADNNEDSEGKEGQTNGGGGAGGAHHVAVVNMGASGPASSAPFSRCHGSGGAGNDSGSRWGVIYGLALHPYGTMAGLLLHASSTYWPVMAWDAPSSSSFSNSSSIVGGGAGPPLSSVMVIWDLKRMVCDTIMPITSALWKDTPAFLTYQNEYGPSLASSSSQMTAVGVLGTSVDFAADTIHVAVGLSDGGVLVWDLRRLSQLLAYIPPSPPSKVWATAEDADSAQSNLRGIRGGPLPAVVKFFTNWVGSSAESSQGNHKHSSSSSPATTCLAVAVGGLLSIYDVRDLTPEATKQPCVKELFLSPSSSSSTTTTGGVAFISRGISSWSSPGDRHSMFAVSSYNHSGVAVVSTLLE